MLVVLRVLIAATGASMVVNLIAPFLGFGDTMVSVDARGAASADIPPDMWTLHTGVGVNTIGYRLAVIHPNAGQRFWYTLGELPAFVLFAGVLMLAYWLIRGTERHGLFTSATAARLRTLGRFLLFGALAKTVVEMAATNRLLASMIASHVGWVYPSSWQIPWILLMVGAAVLTCARIMRIGAEMHDELQGIV
jgi:hypothetical protein